MPIDTEHKKDIDGILYTWKAWPGFQAMVNSVKIAKICGKENAAFLLRLVQEDAMDAIMDEPAVLAQLAVRIAEGVDNEPGGIDFLKDLLKGVKADKVRVGDNEIEANVYDNFDWHFTGRLLHMYKVLGTVAFTSFFLPQDAP